MKKLLLLIAVLFLSFNLKAQTVETDKTSKSKVVDPSFARGGLKGWENFLGSNIRYPKNSYINGVQGQVLIEMTVEADGSLTNFTVLKSPADDLKNEALRVVTLSPKWIPATQDGKPIRATYKVPINFTLSIPEKRPNPF